MEMKLPFAASNRFAGAHCESRTPALANVTLSFYDEMSESDERNPEPTIVLNEEEHQESARLRLAEPILAKHFSFVNCNSFHGIRRL
jgi:hypothetical protein